jgi:alcohol dehydrogenase
VAILDLATAKVKSGISHRSLRPDVAIIDPLNTLTLPPMVTASSGLDVLNHAIESFTTHPYTARPPVAHPRDRAVYAGATPVADLFALESIRWVHRYLRRAFAQPRDIEARYYMMLGASIAGIGFGHAGVHIPHAMGYPLAGMVRQWHPDDYDFGYPISPHGISTAIPAAYVLPFLVRFQPARFEVVAQALGLKGGSLKTLSDELMAYYLDLLDTFGVPTRLAEMGFTTDDLDRLVEGTWAQQRLLTLAPKMVTKEELRRLWEMMIVGA